MNRLPLALLLFVAAALCLTVPYEWPQQILTPDVALKSYYGQYIATEGDWMFASEEQATVDGTANAGQVHVYKRQASGLFEETQ
ncbi:hypothetical protein KIPB_008949, partial [Kipferlia bialata]|eukprot:g8949.t1